jgi:hypothetical protein
MLVIGELVVAVANGWFTNFGTNGYFNGEIGQVSIYDRGLSSSEVTASYSDTRGLYQGLTPTFGTPTATSDGFTVQITNYAAAYTWAGTATASGSVSISESGLVTVTGVAAGTPSTATITTTRTGYSGATATVTATSITGNALTPTFGTPTATADGFTAQITNYDAAYTWAPPTVSTGSVAVTSTVGSNRLLTVTGLAPGASATITATTTRSGYNNGSATVVGTASTGAALTPTFGTPTITASGFTVQISNYSADCTHGLVQQLPLDQFLSMALAWLRLLELHPQHHQRQPSQPQGLVTQVARQQ